MTTMTDTAPDSAHTAQSHDQQTVAHQQHLSATIGDKKRAGSEALEATMRGESKKPKKQLASNQIPAAMDKWENELIKQRKRIDSN